MNKPNPIEQSNGMEEILLDLLDNDDNAYKGRFVGALLAEDSDYAVYQKEDNTILIHDFGCKRAFVPTDRYGNYDLNELRECVSEELYIEVMNALGEEPIIDI